MLLTDTKKILIFCFGALMSLCVAVRAQYNIESWTTDDGLPQNTVYSILQTPDGYLWMTTLDGLVRFDGVRFTVFNKNNTTGIESNRLTNLILDGRGDLWIGAETDFVTRFHQGNFQTFSIKSDEQENPIGDMFLDSSGEVLVTTRKNVFRRNNEIFAKDAALTAENLGELILLGNDKAAWYKNNGTLFRVRDNQKIEYRLPVGKKDVQISRLLEDSRGRVWIGTQNAGLFYFESGKIERYAPVSGDEDITPRIEDADGNVWAGNFVIAPDGKLSRVTVEQGLSENLVTTVFQDRERNVWIGTAHRGINRLSRQKVNFYSTADGLAVDGVYPIFQDRTGDIWLGGNDLTLFHEEKFAAVEGRGKLSKAVTAISQDRTGRIWFGNWGGAYYLENGKFTDFSDKFNQIVSVYVIYEDKNKTLWFGTNSGLFQYQNDVMTRRTTAEGLAGNDVKIIRESDDGTLWIGTYGGLTRIKNDVLTSYTKNDGLASDLVRSLYEDADKTLWIGSYDGGLTRLKDGKFTRYTSKDGLFNDGVFQILEDAAGNLWMSSNRGIYLVAKSQLNDFADGRINHIESIAYSKADGLLETECNGGQQPAGIKTDGGEFWFPTQNGVAVIKPDAIKTNLLAPPVVIESAKVDNEAVAPVAIEIAPGKNNLEISYTALSFIKSEFVKFRYKLEGQDENWVEAGTRRTAYYSYLPPGEYVFHVIAANADGVWNTDGAKTKIVVKPPVYRTWWFWILAAAAIGGAAYFFYRWRVAQLEKARRAQEEFSRKLLASQEHERQRIAAELHDSIGQSLLIIKNRAFLALSDLDEPETVREQLEELSESATGAIEECREISYNLRPYQINRFGLTKTLEAIFRRISEVTKIETTVALDSIDDIFSQEAETNIFRIVQESVNNIIKHSDASEADFFIKRRGGEVDILIQDNGRGFDKNAATNGRQRGGFGLIGMTERARMLGGVYEIESFPDNGTTVKIKLTTSATNERN